MILSILLFPIILLFCFYVTQRELDTKNIEFEIIIAEGLQRQADLRGGLSRSKMLSWTPEVAMFQAKHCH